MSGQCRVTKIERLFEDSSALVACCSVEPGQAKSLTADELASMQSCIDVVRDRSAAARLVAQDLFSSAGIGNWQLPRIIGNGPIWPDGWTGSLSPSGVPGTGTRALIGTDSGAGFRFASAMRSPMRSSACSPMPTIPPQQTFIPLSRTTLRVCRRSSNVRVEITRP